MVFSNVIAFFIILATAAVLHASGVTNIRSAAEAAEALRPLAGDLRQESANPASNGRTVDFGRALSK